MYKLAAHRRRRRRRRLRIEPTSMLLGLENCFEDGFNLPSDSLHTLEVCSRNPFACGPSRLASEHLLYPLVTKDLPLCLGHTRFLSKDNETNWAAVLIQHECQALKRQPQR